MSSFFKKAINKINKKNIFIFVLLIFFINTIFGIYSYFRLKTYYGFYDFKGNWICCGYVLHRLNPLVHVGENLVPELGPVFSGFGNLPYGLLLGNIFYPGFLNFNLAKIWFFVITFIVEILLVLFSYKFFKEKYKSNFNVLYFSFLFFTIFSINILASIGVGNIGHIMCMLILLSIFTLDSYPILSGIFLSLAMIKPQIALPFCLTMLFMMKWVPVVVAAIIDIVSTFITAVLVNENMFKLFIDFLNAKVGKNATIYGILSFLYKDNMYSALFPSMIFGVLLLILFLVLLKNKKDIFILYSIPAIISSIWSYAWNSDHYILIIPTVACFILFLSYKIRIFDYIFLFIFSGYNLFCICILHILKFGQPANILHSLFNLGTNNNCLTFNDFFLLFSLIIFIYINNRALKTKNE